MGIFDDSDRRVQEEAAVKKAASLGQKENQEALRRRTQTQYSQERASLEILKGELQPFYTEMQKSPVTLFLLPDMSPLRIEQKNKLSKPELICDYGSQKQRGPVHLAKKVRTKITIASGTDNYEIEEQGLINVGTGSGSKAMWIRNPTPVTEKNNPYIAELKGAAEYMEERIKLEIDEHTKLKTSRKIKTAAGLGAVALAAFLGLSQCSDANATDSQHSDDQTDKIGLLDNYDHEL